MGFVQFSKLMIGTTMLTGLMATSSMAQDRVLKVTNWAEYI